MMHLDTIFTQTSYNEAIIFNHEDYNIEDLDQYYVATRDSNHNKLIKQNYKFIDILKDLDLI